MKNSWVLLITFMLTCSTALAQSDYSLTILHNNDGESRVINAGSGLESYGGIARFATLLNDTRTFYEGEGHGVLTISSGDNFLAGAEFEASRDSGTYYDALALSRINYDAVILGNHEFDFGTGVLADFIDQAQTTNSTTFLSANLDFSGDAALAARVASGFVAPSKIVSVGTSVGNKNVGIIGATTENLSFISSPGDVMINNVAAAVNAEIASLKAAGVDHIVLASHLQGIAEDQSLIPLLDEGIDLVIAGGGDDRLGNDMGSSPTSEYGSGAPSSVADTGWVPGDDSDGDYPVTTAIDSNNNTVPIVSTDANYKYLGRITLNIDGDTGAVTVDETSNPQRVGDTSVAGGVAADSTIQSESVAPVSAFVATLETTVIGQTSGQIVGGASSDLIRSGERNGGNLVADAIFAKATELANLDSEIDAPMIAMVNGGGIRADIAAGDVSLLDTFNVSRFQNFVSVVEDVAITDLKQLLENAYSKVFDDPTTTELDPIRVGSGTGRFAHLSGMSVVFDIAAQEMVLDGSGNILQQGERILDVVLDDGTILIEDGEIVFSGTIDIATLNFLANGGDQYFDEDYLSQAYSFANFTVTDQQSLADYIGSFGGADLFADSRYDGFADGRIVIVAIPEPNAVVCSMFALLVGSLTRRRKTA